MASLERICEALPRSRADALALGVKRYFTGQPCAAAGHISARYLKGSCCACMKEAQDRWRAANPDENRIRQYISRRKRISKTKITKQIEQNNKRIERENTLTYMAQTGTIDSELLKLPRSRREAIQQGFSHYFTGIPCKNGHLDRRFTKHIGCVKCYREIAARRFERNPDAVRRESRNRRAKARKSNPIFIWATLTMHRIGRRSRKHGIPFSLTRDDILKLCVEECPALRVPLNYEASVNDPYGPSLDKIIPKMGYVLGNVAVISRRANTIKTDATVLELKNVSSWLSGVLSDIK